ncbi:hypothetical protein HDU93_000907 [Gonapodya sp. JEL0774]|nr:hypothetical protein HDU93_000907 [Gonapodya sp. JEL0774]
MQRGSHVQCAGPLTQWRHSWVELADIEHCGLESVTVGGAHVQVCVPFPNLDRNALQPLRHLPSLRRLNVVGATLGQTAKYREFLLELNPHLEVVDAFTRTGGVVEDSASEDDKVFDDPDDADSDSSDDDDSAGNNMRHQNPPRFSQTIVGRRALTPGSLGFREGQKRRPAPEPEDEPLGRRTMWSGGRDMWSGRRVAGQARDKQQETDKAGGSREVHRSDSLEEEFATELDSMLSQMLDKEEGPQRRTRTKRRRESEDKEEGSGEEEGREVGETAEDQEGMGDISSPSYALKFKVTEVYFVLSTSLDLVCAQDNTTTASVSVKADCCLVKVAAPVGPAVVEIVEQVMSSTYLSPTTSLLSSWFSPPAPLCLFSPTTTVSPSDGP